MALPLLLNEATPAVVAVIGLTSIVGAVTSSFSASILSAASMVSWNVFRGMLSPDASSRHAATRAALGADLSRRDHPAGAPRRERAATLVLHQRLDLRPSLSAVALRAVRSTHNRTGSIAAFVVSLALRLGGGEPILGMPALIPYVEIFSRWLPGGPAIWLDSPERATLFPVRTLAAVVGLILLPLVSRLTARWDPPRPLPRPEDGR